MRKGARFVGELHAAGLVIEEGGYIKGSIDLSRHPAHSHPAADDGSNSMDSYSNLSELGPVQQLSEAVLSS